MKMRTLCTRHPRIVAFVVSLERGPFPRVYPSRPREVLLDPAAGNDGFLAGRFQGHDDGVEPRLAAGDQEPGGRHAAAGAARLLQGLDHVEEIVAGEDCHPHEQQRLPRGEQV